MVDERDTRRQEAQAQILAQEILLRRQQQRRGGAIGRFDSNELLHVGPDIAQEPLPRRFIGRRSFLGHRRRQPLVHRERKRARAGNCLVELQAESRSVDERDGSQLIHLARQGASERHELRAIETLKLRVGELQRGQRRGDVARELELLARDKQHLLDLGKGDLVARGREVAIKRLERRLLRLRFGDPCFEQRGACLRVTHLGREIRLRLARRLSRRFDGGEPLGNLVAQIALRAATIEPGRSSHNQGEEGDNGDPRPRSACHGAVRKRLARGVAA